jgi:hypothetical protein
MALNIGSHAIQNSKDSHMVPAASHTHRHESREKYDKYDHIIHQIYRNLS